MLYEIELLTDSRNAARLIAKILVTEQLISTAKMVSCDSLTVENGMVCEKSGVLIIGLTTKPNKIIPTIKSIYSEDRSSNMDAFSNMRIRAVKADKKTEHACIAWCGEPENTNTSTEKEAEQVEVSEQSEQNEEASEKTSKKHKLPKWAREKGMTYREYNKQCLVNTAARWGLTLQEYNKLRNEAKKQGKTLANLLTELGYTYNKEK